MGESEGEERERGQSEMEEKSRGIVCEQLQDIEGGWSKYRQREDERDGLLPPRP